MKPIFLEGYDLFKELQDWVKVSSRYAVRRCWQIQSWEGNKFICRLNWFMGTQVAGLEKTAISPEEAVWLVLDEFRRLEAKL